MTATITITLSDAAQRAALVAGEPAVRKQTYEVPAELTARLLALPWARIDDYGDVACAVPARLEYSRHDIEQSDDPPTPSRDSYGYGCVEGILDARPAVAEAAIAAAESALAGYVAHVLAERVEYRARRDRLAAEAEARAAELDREHAEWCAAWAVRPLAERAELVALHDATARGAAERCPDAYRAASEYADARQAEAKAAKDAAAAERLAAKLARRAEIGAVEIDITRGDRDWGVPWGAVVTAGRGRRDDYDFDAGSYDLSAEVLTIRCAPGDVIAWGQKNYRKPKRTLHYRRRVAADWRLETI